MTITIKIIIENKKKKIKNVIRNESKSDAILKKKKTQTVKITILVVFISNRIFVYL